MQSMSLDHTRSIAQNFLQTLTPGQSHAMVIGLKGDLGAGKTTFVQQVAALLGVTETITSPTFVIEKIYKLSHPHYTHLIHIDAYRLESEKEILSLGWNEIIADPKNLIMIEWPEKVAGVMPQTARYIQLTFIDDTTREIMYE